VRRYDKDNIPPAVILKIRPYIANPEFDPVLIKKASNAAYGQGLTVVHLSAQPEPFWSHLPVSRCLIVWGDIMHPTYPTKCAYVEPKS